MAWAVTVTVQHFSCCHFALLSTFLWCRLPWLGAHSDASIIDSWYLHHQSGRSTVSSTELSFNQTIPGLDGRHDVAFLQSQDCVHLCIHWDLPTLMYDCLTSELIAVAWVWDWRGCMLSNPAHVPPCSCVTKHYHQAWRHRISVMVHYVFELHDVRWPWHL